MHLHSHVNVDTHKRSNGEDTTNMKVLKATEGLFLCRQVVSGRGPVTLAVGITAEITSGLQGNAMKNINISVLLL